MNQGQISAERQTTSEKNFQTNNQNLETSSLFQKDCCETEERKEMDTSTFTTAMNGFDGKRSEANALRHQDAGQQQQQSSKTQARKLSNFYANKNIFVTGSTGFIGKVLLIKLMGSFENAGQVYVMLRGKKGLTAQQRLNKMISEQPFTFSTQSTSENTDQQNSNSDTKQKVDYSKIIAIEGDMNCEHLGLADDVKEKLSKTVDIVFNIAASVQFDAPLKQNLHANYMGTRNLLQLATKFERLISLVHVSTFYTNSHLSHVEEKVLPMSRDCEKMADLISWIPDSLCDSIAPQIMENRPNTYIFTKAMAENLVQKYQGRLPIAIVRPSIVTPSVKDPIPGWVDNVNGPMGLGVLAALGILRNMDWNYYGVGDMIPVDVVANTMLTVAERTARLYPNEIKVYNCSSSSLNPVTWGGGFEILRVESFKAPPYKMLRVPIKVPKHREVNKLLFGMTKLSELLFAYFVDFILMICGQKQILTKLTLKLQNGYKLLRPFTTVEYTCSNDNLMAAFDELHPDDKCEFNFDVKSLHYPTVFKDAYYGARRFLLKEDISNVPAALFKLKIHQAIEFVFSAMFYSLVGWTTYRLYGYFSSQLSSL